jgi:hypothetical protein
VRLRDPPTTNRLGDLKLPADLQHARHGHALNPGRAANVVMHSLFFLVRVFDNAKPAGSTGCLYSGLNSP